jgi:hypothetical protein
MSSLLGSLPPIHFYISPRDWLDTFPTNTTLPWSGFGKGIYSWTLQTYLELHNHGIPCELCQSLPATGIIFTHRASIGFDQRPQPGQLLVCFNADRGPHPYAQINIVQNPMETRRARNSYYMPHWPQPGLIPRNPSRGARLENIVYMGISYNLAPELLEPQWRHALTDMGLSWHIRDREFWHDYSEVDAVVAVRRFNSDVQYAWKPATKLYNSWLAGVPALLGRESGFRLERQGVLDYFEINSIDEALTVLKRLKTDPQLYMNVIDQGKKRAETCSRSRLVQLWRNLIEDVLVVQYNNWIGLSKWQYETYLYKCYAAVKMQGIRRRLLGVDPQSSYKL